MERDVLVINEPGSAYLDYEDDDDAATDNEELVVNEDERDCLAMMPPSINAENCRCKSRPAPTNNADVDDCRAMIPPSVF